MQTKVRNNGKAQQVIQLRQRADSLERLANSVFNGTAAHVNRNWLDSVPQGGGEDKLTPVMVNLDLSPSSIANLVRIKADSGHSIDAILSVCINHGKDLVDMTNYADNPEELAKIGL